MLTLAAGGSPLDPIYNFFGAILAFFYSIIPNLGVSIILLTVVVMLALFPLTAKQARTTPEDSGRGQSADKTLGWDWKVDKDGSRKFRVYQWKGGRYAQVLYNDIPAAPAR